MYFRNSNAQSPVIKFTGDGKTVLSYITIGGIIEVYFFIHGSAKSIIQQYQNVIGHPNLPPYWSLGWQQASWKYINQGMVTEVIDKYQKAGINLETVYLDIPYMNKYSDFSVDKEAFPDLPGLITALKQKNQKIVPIIDGALSAVDL
jgi:alpha-glucosidase